MTGHASVETLARFSGGDLKPRKAAKIASHLAGCSLCSGRLRELENVTNVLASVHFSPIPDHLSNRISAAIASESAARVASLPASEAGRGELPTRARPARRGWRLPGLSSPGALRLVAAAGAAVILAGGGYELVSHIGGPAGPSSTSSSAQGSAGSPAAPGSQLRAGPTVQYTHAGHTDFVQAVQSSTNFQPGTLRAQAIEAMTVARLNYSPLNGPSSAGSSLSQSPAARAIPAPAGSGLGKDVLNRLRGCVGKIAAGRQVLLVDLAKYLGKPATIMVIGSLPTGPAEVVAVGAQCSVSGLDILARLEIARL